MSFSFDTKPRWRHNHPHLCTATLSFTKTQSGKAQIQVKMTDKDGNSQYTWSSLTSERAEGILSSRLRPFINYICGTSMGPEIVIKRDSLIAQLEATNEKDESLRSLLDGCSIPMSVVTRVVQSRRNNQETEVKVVSFLTVSERNEDGAMEVAKSLNTDAPVQNAETAISEGF